MKELNGKEHELGRRSEGAAFSRYVLSWTNNTTKLNHKSCSRQVSNSFHRLFPPNIMDFHSTLHLLSHISPTSSTTSQLFTILLKKKKTTNSNYSFLDKSSFILFCNGFFSDMYRVASYFSLVFFTYNYSRNWYVVLI